MMGFERYAVGLILFLYSEGSGHSFGIPCDCPYGSIYKISPGGLGGIDPGFPRSCIAEGAYLCTVH